jgi:tRNA (guanosine-2'-O-)-methyltransferase
MTQFLTEERKEVLRRTLASRTHYMRIMTENMFHPQNASAIMRHCEAFGIQQIHTVEDRCRFDPSVNIVRGTQKWVDVEHHDTTKEALEALKSEGYRIVATTPHRCSVTPETFDVTKGKFALVFGTEHAGISDEVIEAADDFLMIPMCGMVESLNVSASAAILIYMLSQRIRQQVDGWQLSDDEQLKLLTRWTMSSVRDFEGILRKAEQSGKFTTEY